jgi:hypothetical protein
MPGHAPRTQNWPKSARIRDGSAIERVSVLLPSPTATHVPRSVLSNGVRSKRPRRRNRSRCWARFFLTNAHDNTHSPLTPLPRGERGTSGGVFLGPRQRDARFEAKIDECHCAILATTGANATREENQSGVRRRVRLQRVPDLDATAVGRGARAQSASR